MKEVAAMIMANSMRLAENGGERNLEDFVIVGVADMHDPVAPVFGAAFAEAIVVEGLGFPLPGSYSWTAMSPSRRR